MNLKYVVLTILSIGVAFLMVLNSNVVKGSSFKVNYSLNESAMPDIEVFDSGEYSFSDIHACMAISDYYHGRGTLASAIAPLDLPAKSFTGSFEDFLSYVSVGLDEIVPKCAYVASGSVLVDKIDKDIHAREEFDMIIHSYVTLRGKYIKSRLKDLNIQSGTLNEVLLAIKNIDGLNEEQVQCLSKWVVGSRHVVLIGESKVFIKKRNGDSRVLRLYGEWLDEVLAEAQLSCNGSTDEYSSIESVQDELIKLSTLRGQVLKQLDGNF